MRPCVRRCSQLLGPPFLRPYGTFTVLSTLHGLRVSYAAALEGAVPTRRCYMRLLLPGPSELAVGCWRRLTRFQKKKNTNCDRISLTKETSNAQALTNVYISKLIPHSTVVPK